MKEITDFLGTTYECDCIGCSIANHDIIAPGGIIYESDDFILHQDPEIPIRGFLIFTAKQHINSIIQLSETQQINLIRLINKSILALKSLQITSEVTILQEERSSHLHIWIYPYHSWMNNNFGRGISYSRDINNYSKNHMTDFDKQNIIETVNDLRIYFNENT